MAAAETEVGVLPLPHPDVIPAAKRAIGEGISARLRELYPTQGQAAAALEMNRTDLSPLFTGKFERFSLAWLLMTASRVGLDVEIEMRHSAENNHG